MTFVYFTHMPTILIKAGWRFFFYCNEGNEPIHIHCQSAEKECKFWLISETYDVEAAYSYSMNSKDIRKVKKIIFENFDYIESEWKKVHTLKNEKNS